MTTGTYEAVDQHAEEIHPYRAMSRAAVLSLVLAFLSLLALITATLLIVPVVGCVSGALALSSIKRYPLELTGRGVALVSIVLNGVLLVSGICLHTYIYATEVPEGYVRVSFADLQPVEEAPHLPVPPAALELDGKQIFVKGYVYPDGQQYNIKRFVLVPDMGTCCFGGQPKLTDMIEVTLRDPYRVEFARRKRKLGGRLRVDTRVKPVSGLGGVYYQLDADYVR